MIKELSSYITGLTNMASSMSKKISYSYIEADAFDLKDYKKGISKYYKIPLDSLNFTKIEQSLEEIFSIFLEKDIVENLLYWINTNIGKEINVYTIDDSEILDSLSCFCGGVLPFYTIEDIYVAEYKEYVVCFVIGNNE